MADNNMSVSTAIAGKKTAYKGKKLRVAIIGCGGKRGRSWKTSPVS